MSAKAMQGLTRSDPGAEGVRRRRGLGSYGLGPLVQQYVTAVLILCAHLALMASPYHTLMLRQDVVMPAHPSVRLSDTVGTLWEHDVRGAGAQEHCAIEWSSPSVLPRTFLSNPMTVGLGTCRTAGGCCTAPPPQAPVPPQGGNSQAFLQVFRN